MTFYTSIGMNPSGQLIIPGTDDRAIGILYAADNLAGLQNIVNARLNLGLASVAVSGSYSDLINTPNVNNPSFTNPVRSLNSAFQVSSTQNCLISYSIDISCTLSLTGGQTGTLYLRYADDSGHTTNVKEVCRFVNANTGSLTIGLNITQAETGTLSGMIPAGKYVKLVTENTAGSPTFTYRSAQEVLL